MKDDSNDDIATALFPMWTRMKNELLTMVVHIIWLVIEVRLALFETYDGNNVKFGNDAPCPM